MNTLANLYINNQPIEIMASNDIINKLSTYNLSTMDIISTVTTIGTQAVSSISDDNQAFVIDPKSNVGLLVVIQKNKLIVTSIIPSEHIYHTPKHQLI